MYTLILRYFGFINYIVNFFSDYLVDRSIQHFQNFFLSDIYNIDISMGQDSVLYPILLVLYIVFLICIFEIRAQTLSLNTFILLFVNNSFLIYQRKSYNITLSELDNSYKVVTNLIVLFGLVIKYNKLEIFYFSKVHNDFNSELDLLAIYMSELKMMDLIFFSFLISIFYFFYFLIFGLGIKSQYYIIYNYYKLLYNIILYHIYIT